MLRVFRERALNKAFGTGVTGAIGVSIVEWGIKRVSAAFDDDGEVLDVSRLIPGETYEITTRPAPDRAERKLAARVERLDRQAARITTPTRSRRKVAKKVDKARTAAERAAGNTAKQARILGELAGLEARCATLSTPTARQQKILDERDRRSAELRAREAAAIEAARRHARSPRRQVFR